MLRNGGGAVQLRRNESTLLDNQGVQTFAETSCSAVLHFCVDGLPTCAQVLRLNL